MCREEYERGGEYISVVQIYLNRSDMLQRYPRIPKCVVLCRLEQARHPFTVVSEAYQLPFARYSLASAHQKVSYPHCCLDNPKYRLHRLLPQSI